jgi:hypothetical protein
MKNEVYFKEYFVNRKFIGYKNFVEKDRKHLGFKGEQTEILAETIILENKNKIKAGTTVSTMLQLLDI